MNTLLDTLSHLQSAIASYEDRAEVSPDATDSLTEGHVLGYEIAGLLHSAAMNGNFRQAVDLAKGLTSFDVEAYLMRYPDVFLALLQESNTEEGA